MTFAELDRQLASARAAPEIPVLSDRVWECLATTVHDEIGQLPESVTNQLRLAMRISPEHYAEEMSSFQAWIDIARANDGNPVIVRARVMTEVYVSFVWLRDSIMKPIAAAVAKETTFAEIDRFLNTDRRRNLRNAIAHGNWRYLPSFEGLEIWDGQREHIRFEISAAELGAWQLLSRGTAIAALLALTE